MGTANVQTDKPWLTSWIRAILTGGLGHLVAEITQIDHHPPEGDLAVRFGHSVPEGAGESLVASRMFSRSHEVAGFLNLWLTDLALEQWRGRERPLAGRRVAVEHTSITPCYPINVATARSAILGEQLRRCAAALGADAEGRFWFEDDARQRELVRLAGDMRLSEFGKPDHVMGVVFATALAAVEGPAPWYDRLCGNFPDAQERARELWSPGGRTPTLDDDHDLMEAYRTTLIAMGVRSIAFDRQSDVWDRVARGDFGEALADARSRNSASRESTAGEDRPRYWVRNSAYYHHLLEQFDEVHSVVSYRQRDIVNRACALLAIDSGRLRVHFFGDVVGTLGPDVLKKGVFHSVDEHLISASGALSAFRSAVLGRGPLVPLSLEVLGDSAPRLSSAPTHRSPMVAAVLLLDELNAILLDAADSCRFAVLERWLRNANHVVVAGGGDAGVLREIRTDLMELGG